MFTVVVSLVFLVCPKCFSVFISFSQVFLALSAILRFRVAGLPLVEAPRALQPLAPAAGVPVETREMIVQTDLAPEVEPVTRAQRALITPAPSAARRPAAPAMLKVFPRPVWPYANIVASAFS